MPDIPATLKPLAAGAGDRRAKASGAWWRRSTASPAILSTLLRDGGRTPPTPTASPRSTSGWSGSHCGPAPKTQAPVTGACPTTSRRGSARACSPRSTAGSSSTRAGGGFYLNGIYHGTLVNGRRVDRLLQERHDQDRRVGPGLHYELLDRGRQAEPQAARGPRQGCRRRQPDVMSQLGRDARRRRLGVAVRYRHHQGRPDRLRLRSGARRAGPRACCCSGPARSRACRWTSTRPG